MNGRSTMLVVSGVVLAVLTWWAAAELAESGGFGALERLFGGQSTAIRLASGTEVVLWLLLSVASTAVVALSPILGGPAVMTALIGVALGVAYPQLLDGEAGRVFVTGAHAPAMHALAGAWVAVTTFNLIRGRRSDAARGAFG